MQRTHQFFDRHGREISEREAIDHLGIIRDGITMRTKMQVMDGGDERVLRRLLQNVRGPSMVHDHSGDPFGLHRPGFRMTTDSRMNDAPERAYRDYERSLTTDYLNPTKHRRRDEDDDAVVKRTSDARRNNGDDKECPDCAGTGIDAVGDECPVCHGEGIVPACYESDPEEIVRNTQPRIEGLGAQRTEGRSLSQLMRDHQNKMAVIYDHLDQKLSNAWRQT